MKFREVGKLQAFFDLRVEFEDLYINIFAAACRDCLEGTTELENYFALDFQKCINMKWAVFVPIC